MYVSLRRAMAIALVAGIPVCLMAAPDSASTGDVKGIQAREASAKTAADHLWLANYYDGRAHAIQSNLTEAQDMMARWSSMEGREKTPNAYSHAKSLVAAYTEQLQHANLKAAEHRKLAESLQARMPVAGQQTAMK